MEPPVIGGLVVAGMFVMIALHVPSAWPWPLPALSAPAH